MECLFECIYECFAESIAACCGAASDTLAVNKHVRRFLSVMGMLLVIAIPVTGAIGIVCLSESEYGTGAVLLGVSGGLLVVCIVMGVIAECKRRKRKKLLRETTDTDGGNAYRACVQCDGSCAVDPQASENAEKDCESKEGENL